MTKNHRRFTVAYEIQKNNGTPFDRYSRTSKYLLLASKRPNNDESNVDNPTDQDQKELGPVARVGKFGSKLIFSRREKDETEGSTKLSKKDGNVDTDGKKQGNWIRRIMSQRNDSKDGDVLLNNDESDEKGMVKDTVKDTKRFGILNRGERQNDSNKIVPSPTDPKLESTSKLLLLGEKEGNLSSSLIELDDILVALDDSLLFVKKQLEDLGSNKSSSYLWYDSNNDTFLSAEQDQERLNTLKRDLEQRRKEIILLIQKRKKELEPAQLEKAEKIRDSKRQQRKQIEKKELEPAQLEKAEKIRDSKRQQRKQIEIKSKNKEEQFPPSKKKITPPQTKQPPLFKELKEEPSLDEKGKSSEKGAISGIISSAVESIVNTAQSGISYAIETARSKKIDNIGKNEEEWMTVCPKTRISPGEVYPVVAGGLDLLVIGSRDGTKVYCVANSCPHLGTPLESGIIQSRAISVSSASATSNSLSTDDDTKESKAGYEDCIICPLHRTEFSLDTGEVRGEWCPYPPVLGNIMGNMKAKNKLPTFKMRTRGKNIEIMIVSKIDDDGGYVEGPVKTNE